MVNGIYRPIEVGPYPGNGEPGHRKRKRKGIQIPRKYAGLMPARLVGKKKTLQ
jgi:hypothetical protein